MVPYSIECWIENMTRKYNYKIKMFETHPGINVYTKDFGTTKSFEVMDPSVPVKGSIYFKPLTDFLRSKGY